MPTGVPISVAIKVCTRLPNIALSRPPALPGGGVICVNTANETPAAPFRNSVARIHTSAIMPAAAAPQDSIIASRLRRRRRAYSDMYVCSLFIYRPSARFIRSEEHTSELQSLMRISYAVFCLQQKKTNTKNTSTYYLFRD